MFHCATLFVLLIAAPNAATMAKRLFEDTGSRKKSSRNSGSLSRATQPPRQQSDKNDDVADSPMPIYWEEHVASASADSPAQDFSDDTGMDGFPPSSPFPDNGRIDNDAVGVQQNNDDDFGRPRDDGFEDSSRAPVTCIGANAGQTAGDHYNRREQADDDVAIMNTASILVINGHKPPIGLPLDQGFDVLANHMEDEEMFKNWYEGQPKSLEICTFRLNDISATSSSTPYDENSLQFEDYVTASKVVYAVIGKVNRFSTDEQSRLPGPDQYDFICIVPTKAGSRIPPVQLLRPKNKFSVRRLKNEYPDTHRGVLANGREFSLFRSPVARLGVKGKGKVQGENKFNFTTAGDKTTRTVVATLWQETMGKQSSTRAIRRVPGAPLCNVIINDSFAEFMNDDKPYWEKHRGLKIVGSRGISTTGCRRQEDERLDYSEFLRRPFQHPLDSKGSWRESLLAKQCKLGQVTITGDDFIRRLDEHLSVGTLSEGERDAICATLLGDPAWKVSPMKSQDVELTTATIDIDQVLGMGVIRPDLLKRSSCATVSPESPLDGPEVKAWLQEWLPRIIQVLVPHSSADSPEAKYYKKMLFNNVFMQQTVSFSKHDVFTKLGKWGTSVTASSACKKSYYIPSLHMGTSVLQIAVRFMNGKGLETKGRI